MASFKLLALMTVTSSHVAFAATPACANEEGMGYDDPENQQPSLFLHDAQACQNACLVYCKFFTFYPKNTWHPNSTLGGCYLQGEAAKLKSLEGAISGPKSCNASDAVTGAGEAEVETTAAPTAAAAAAVAEVETTAAPTAAAAAAAAAVAEVETTAAPTAAAAVEVETTAAPTAAAAPPPAAAAAAAAAAAVVAEVETTATPAATVAAAEVTTAAPSPEPAPTSAEEAAEQAVQKLHPYAPIGTKASAAALGAASFAFAEGKSRQVVGEVAENAAKTLLANASGVTRQIQVNHMAEAVGKVFANQTMFNMTSQEAADRTEKSIDNFANDIYEKPEAASSAVLAAGASVSVATGAFPTPVKTDTAKPADSTETASEETASTTVQAEAADSSTPEAAKKAVDDAAASVSNRDITLPAEEKKPEEKSGGIPPWVWLLIALALLACLAGAYMFLCAGSSKDKKKKTKTNKTAPRDVEAAPLLKDVQMAPAPAAVTSVYSAPVAAAAAGGLPAGSVAQGTVLSQGSPMYSTSARGFALPQGSPVAGSNMVMMPQAAPVVTVAPPQYVSQAQPMMMPGGMSVASQPMAQVPMMGAQMTGAQMDLFNRLDANHDGQLSAQEFAQLAAMRQQ